MGGLLAKPRKGQRSANPVTNPSTTRTIAVGSAFPDVSVDYGFPPQRVNMPERLKGKKTILVGLPGAFTPT
eukprot:3865527-Pyramimonas_sp.AAC.1